MLLNVLSIRPFGTMFSKMRIEIKDFFHKNAFERIVCEMVAILSRDGGLVGLVVVVVVVVCVCVCVCVWGGGGGYLNVIPPFSASPNNTLIDCMRSDLLGRSLKIYYHLIGRVGKIVSITICSNSKGPGFPGFSIRIYYNAPPDIVLYNVFQYTSDVLSRPRTYLLYFSIANGWKYNIVTVYVEIKPRDDKKARTRIRHIAMNCNMVYKAIQSKNIA